MGRGGGDAAGRCRGGGKGWYGALCRWRVSCACADARRGEGLLFDREGGRGRRARSVCRAARCRSLPATVGVAMTCIACPPDPRV